MGKRVQRITHVDIHREIRYITSRAQAGDARMVSLGSLVFFSTASRDAWMLDAEDRYALCLCRDGEPQPHRILETEQTFAIEWTADFAIEGEKFVVRQRGGRTLVMDGYPTSAIASHLQT
jgi:hypothetical protein